MSVAESEDTTETRADRHEVGRGGLFTMSGSLYAAAAGFGLTLVLGRLFGAQVTGLYFMSVSVFMILNGVALVGSDTGLVRSIATWRALERPHRVWAGVLATLVPGVVWSLIVAAVLAVLAGPLARGLAPQHATEQRDYLMVVALTLVFSAVGQAALNATRSFDTLVPYVALYQLWLPTTRILGVVVVALLGGAESWLIWSWAIPLVAMDLYAVWFVVHRALREKAGVPHEPLSARRVLKEEWSFNIGRGISTLFQLGLVWLDVLIVGAYLGPEIAGAYAAASRFMTSGTMAMQAMVIGTGPMLAGAFARKQTHRVQDIYDTSTTWVVLLSWPLFLVLATFAPWILGLIGDDFAVAAPAMAVMSLTALLYVALGNINAILLMGGKSGATAVIAGVSLALNIGLNVMLIPVFGLIGAAVAWAIALVFDSVACLIVGHRQFSLRFGLGPVSRAAVIAVLAFGLPGAVVRLVGEQSLIWVAAYLVVAALVYAALLRLSRHALGLGSLGDLLRRKSVT